MDFCHDSLPLSLPSFQRPLSRVSSSSYLPFFNSTLLVDSRNRVERGNLATPNRMRYPVYCAPVVLGPAHREPSRRVLKDRSSQRHRQLRRPLHSQRQIQWLTLRGCLLFRGAVSIALNVVRPVVFFSRLAWFRGTSRRSDAQIYRFVLFNSETARARADQKEITASGRELGRCRCDQTRWRVYQAQAGMRMESCRQRDSGVDLLGRELAFRQCRRRGARLEVAQRRVTP